MRYSTLWSMPAIQDERLRELFFGDHEGEHFDSNPEIANDINKFGYQAPNGESWSMVRNRLTNFFNQNLTQDGVYLCFTHGGAICSLTHDLGMQNVISNCSVVGLALNEGVPKNIEFEWKFPEILTQ